MQRRGVLPEDAPDPGVELAARARQLPVPVMGLVPQPALEDTGTLGVTDGHDASRLVDMSVSVTYTLWRTPADRADPVNLAALDDQTRAAIERDTPWPRPRWLLEHLQRMRYPQLWDAVRTSWRRDGRGLELVDELAAHADDVAGTRRAELGADRWPSASRRAAAGASRDEMIDVDGVPVRAVEIGTHPALYAIGVQLTPSSVATVVLPRSPMPYVAVALAARDAPTSRGHETQ